MPDCLGYLAKDPATNIAVIFANFPLCFSHTTTAQSNTGMILLGLTREGGRFLVAEICFDEEGKRGRGLPRLLHQNKSVPVALEETILF